jgi:DNA-binding GntR family transcriptional regulator
MASEFRSKKEVVYDMLRKDIIAGKYTPGSRLVIDDLAGKIKVSQIPIREAIQQLEADGFVTIEPYVGARVAEIDATFIYEVFALLESMEIICGRAACKHMSDEELQTLETMIVEMDSSIHQPENWSAQNRAMHLYICEVAKTQLVLKMMHKVFDHWDRLRRHYLRDMPGNRIELAQAEHHLLLKALQQRDADEVEQVLRKHNQSALERYIRHLESTGHLVATKG